MDTTSKGAKLVKYTFGWPWNDVKMGLSRYNLVNEGGRLLLTRSEYGDTLIENRYHGLNGLQIDGWDELKELGYHE